MMKLDFEEQFSVTMEMKDDFNLGYHLLETWRNNKGEVCRPGDLPPIVAYDPETGRRIYRAWPKKDGSFGQRDGNKPSVISEVPGEEAYAYWFGSDGRKEFIADAVDEIKHPVTGEFLGHVFGEPEPCSPRYRDHPVPSVEF